MLRFSIELDNQTKEILAEIMKNGGLVVQNPLCGAALTLMRTQGLLVEEQLPTCYRYALSDDCREYFAMHPHILHVDYSWLQGNANPDYGIL